MHGEGRSGGGERRRVAGCPAIERREFLSYLGLAGGAALTLNLGLFGASVRRVMDPPALPGGGAAKPRFLAGFSRPDLEKYWMGWPGAAYDIEAGQRRYTQILSRAAEELGLTLDIEQAPLTDAERVDALLSRGRERGSAGAVVTVMALHPDGWSAVEHFLKARGDGFPTVVFAPQGTQFTPTLRRFRDFPESFVGATHEVEWLATALRMLKARWQMAHTRFAVIAGDEEREERLEPVGTVLHRMPLRRFAEAYRETEGAEEAEEIARAYMENAKGRVEPAAEDVVEAARTYLANRRIMQETGCHAVTMDCLGLVTRRETPPPCMAYMQLLDEQTCGCCEADVFPGLSLLLSSYLLGRPAFLHNPTPNTVRNTYAGAHCTAPTLMDGFDGSPEPYILRNHHESDWGVAPQILLRKGQPATLLRFLSPGSLMAATGTILSNIDTRPDDGVGGCRTGFEMEMDGVEDVRDMRGHHNVLIYGRHLPIIGAWAQLAGVTVESILAPASA
jgi:hypothetical protein